MQGLLKYGEAMSDRDDMDSGSPRTPDLRSKAEQQVPTGIDISQQKRADELAAASQALRSEIAAHKRAQEDWEKTFDTIPDLVAILDDQHRVVRANRPMAERLGVTAEQCVGLPCYEAVHGSSQPPAFCPHSQTCQDHREHMVEVYEPRLGGYFLVSTTPRFDEEGRFIGTVHIARDITARKRDEEEREIAAGFLRMVNESQTREELIHAAVAFFHEKSGCEAVGIRLKDDDDYPYYEAHGFPQGFLHAENQLCTRDEAGAVIRDGDGYPVCECMCGNVICGRFDPSKPFFTARGSFWTNCTTELLASTSEADRQARTRNRCNGEGYESVALIALTVGKDRLGLLQLNDRCKGRFTAERIALWERLAGYLAVALAKMLAEESLRASEKFQAAVLNSLAAHIAVLDKRGCIIAVNEPWLRFALENGVADVKKIGAGEDYLAASRAAAVAGDSYAVAALGGIESVLQGRQQHFVIEYPCHSPDQQRWFLMHVTANDKEIGGAIVTHTDITERRRAEEALTVALDTQRQIAGAKLEYAALLHLILGCMSRLTGAEGASLEVAEGDEMVYEAATGLAAEFVGLRLKVGQSLSGLSMTSGELVRADDIETDPRVDREACRRIGLRSMVLMPLRYDQLSFGVLKLMSSRIAAFGAAAEQTLRLMGEFLGVTIARKRAEEALRQSEERLRLAQQAARIGTFEWNMQTNVIVWTPELEELYGLQPGSFGGTYEAWTALVHPDDLPQAKEPVQGPLISEVAESEWRVVWPDGSVRWLAGRARAFKDGTGKPLWMVGVNLDITARKQAEEELAAARQAAEQAKIVAEHANHAKDHFLAVLSHELRTPLTPVVMGLSMLQDRPDLDPEVREALEMVHRHVQMEARLVDDLLDVSRIARGKVELTRSPVELCTIIHRAVEVCKPDIEARRLHFGVDLGAAAPYWVHADASRLQQVFWNLLRNAVKFTPHGGCVGIRCRPDEDHLFVEVNDSGIGIDPGSLSRIFDAFEQAERSVTQQFGGLGLGLAISKAMVEMHGGTISAHSEGRGKGATFRIRLPQTTPPGQREMPPAAASPPPAIRPLRILLVEDHGVTAKLMRTVLTSDGHTVESAGDVATALELASQHAFDLLVSDLGLPDGSGHDLMRELRQRGHTFPGIALSGYGQAEDIQRSREAGFAAHLTKPASRKAVVEAVASVTACRNR